MPLALEKARTSSADWNPEEMVTVADSMLVSSIGDGEGGVDDGGAIGLLRRRECLRPPR